MVKYSAQPYSANQHFAWHDTYWEIPVILWKSKRITTVDRQKNTKLCASVTRFAWNPFTILKNQFSDVLMWMNISVIRSKTSNTKSDKPIVHRLFWWCHHFLNNFRTWMDELEFYAPSTVFQSFRDDISGQTVSLSCMKSTVKETNIWNFQQH